MTKEASASCFAVSCVPVGNGRGNRQDDVLE